MTTLTRTAGSAGSFDFTTRNSGGQLITPVSTPTVSWYTDSGRTLGALALTITGSAGTYNASWTGAQAPASGTRYLKATVETSAGVFSTDVDDDILFLAAGITPSVTDYTTLAAVKADLGMNGTADDSAISAAITAASREIDGWCGTTFYPVTEARTFEGSADGVVYVDRFTSTAGLAVTTGTGGSYGTTLLASQYVLQPYNAPSRGLAYDRIYVPTVPTYFGDGWPNVRITAAWGYASVPAPVEQATRLRAIQLYHRREAPHGVASYGDDGVGTTVAFGSDPDVVRLLKPYMDMGIA